MKPLDRVLDRIQRQVELEGKSHAECVYLTNLSFPDPIKARPSAAGRDGL